MQQFYYRKRIKSSLARLRFLSKQFERATQLGESAGSKHRLTELSLKIQAVIRELLGRVNLKMIQRTLGSVSLALFLSLSSRSLQAQNFNAAVPYEPLSNISVPLLHDLADMDNDGDLDVIGLTYDDNTGDQAFVFIENTGSSTEAVFGEVQLAPFGLAAGEDEDLSFYQHAADIDADGDLDLLSMVLDDYADTTVLVKNMIYRENIGTAEVPLFADADTIPLFSQGYNYYYALGTADFDNDGDLDLFSSGANYDLYLTEEVYSSSLVYFENTSDGALSFGEGVLDPFGTEGIRFEFEALEISARPLIADFDLDGDLDIMTGGNLGMYSDSSETQLAPYFTFYENQDGTLASPQVLEEFNASGGFSLGFYAAGDMDGDGDTDIVFNVFDYGSLDNNLMWLENNGGVTNTDNANEIDGSFTLINSSLRREVVLDYQISTVDNLKLRFTDLHGRILSQRELNGAANGRVTISLDGFSSGKYHLQIMGSSGIKTLPFVLN